MQRIAEIVTFPSQASQPEARHVEQLEFAEASAGYALDLIQIEAECARHGARLMPEGGIMSDRALFAVLSVAVALINISGRQRRFRALLAACNLALEEIERGRA